MAGGREVLDRRTDLKAGCIGCTGGAGARSKRQPSIQLAPAVSPGAEKNAEPVKLLPVHVSEAQASKASRTERGQITAGVAGTIQVEFPKGHVCVSGSVDGEALRIVLEHLLR
jgi:hypothetical protein